ncbi:hypothetical protein N7510_004074 [Penicillium lagena]|uniref:uncharacterized protein n=1 Tax=Penicillium lagena TaxID=94218 RepID=UPI0025407F8F|nr:uncharacterized protein N7510_004074 [Penicillium lagena]KAJ5620090.1 hypothetical protein N7510_004074 [Penicillium lagena]
MAEVEKTANAEAEKDVQNVLAELQEEAGDKAPKEDADEARIVAEAAKLGEKSEQTEEKSESARPQRQHTGARGGRGGKRNNAKFDPSSLKETDDPVEIRKQVEFYFSDSNLPMDKFLLSKVGGTANNAVPLELLHSFKRMHRFQPFSAIVEALKSSETLELVEDNTAVKRKQPLPDSVTNMPDPSVVKVFEDQAMARSVYAKGFGSEDADTQLEIEAFFAKYGPVNAIRLRRTADKSFKGSVFVEFASEDKQKEFLALETKPQWKGQDLLIKSKKDYCDEKVEEIKAGKLRPNYNRGGRGRGGNRGGRGGRGGDRDRNKERDWRERRDEDKKNGFQDRKAEKDSRGVPVVQATESAGQKRGREEDANGDHPAKKVDAKE